MSKHKEIKYPGVSFNPLVTFSEGQLGEAAEYHHSMTNEIRISNLEKRLDNAERLLKFYEEMMRLKEDEHRGEYKIDQNKIVELNNKITVLDDNLKTVYKKLSDFNQYLNDKLGEIDKRFRGQNETKNSVSDFYSSKLAEMEAMLNKNNIVIENLIDDKIGLLQNNFDGKLDDLLSLVNDMNKVVEKNDLTIIENKDNIRLIQNDHLSFIKIVSLLKDKADNLDYVMEQITDLKQRYGKIINLYSEHSQEEDKFTNKFFNNTEENN
jgi:hypothetical protein